MAALYWLIAFAVFIGIEAASMALTTIWFAGGALVALLLSVFRVPVPVQLAVFVIVSFALLVLTRPLAIRYVNQRTKKTNVDGLIGKHARVTELVNAESGTAVLNGQEWTARPAKEGLILEVGTMVTVTAIHGVKLIVAPISEHEA